MQQLEELFESDNLQRRVEVVETADGSQTLSVDGGVEHYHSTNGAIAEALHVYINAGLAAIDRLPIRLLEVGFGTGLNAMLSFIYAEKNQREVIYTSVERYPLGADVTSLLRYAEQLGIDRCKYFDSLHAAEWNVPSVISPYFTLQKVEVNLVEFEPTGPIDLVFYDAFAPDLQPELWSTSIFKKIYNAMSSGGILVTYSSKGFVKNGLREVGFSVKRLQGPKGKRHMILAQK